MTTPLMDPTETLVGTSRSVGIWVAPPGTPGPASLTANFATPWLSLGYASDDGVTIGGDVTSESFTPWQSTTPIKTIITERTRTVGFTMWQLNRETLGVYFDEVIPGTSADINFDVHSDSPHRYHAIGVDAQDGDRRLRLVYPRATLESTGDMTINKGAMVPLEVTLSALDDDGVMVHVWVGSTPASVTRSSDAPTARGGARKATAPEAAVSVGK